MVSRYGTRGGFKVTSAPKRSFIRSTITSTWICERPATICSPVWASRWRSIVGSSSWRRRERERVFAVACGQDVTRVGLLELGHRADVAGPELVAVPHLLALRDEQLPDPLLHVRPAVVDLGVG